MSGFIPMLRSRWAEGRFVCVGLDSAHDALPASVRARRSVDTAVLAFNRAIVDATAEFVCAYKPNIAFYARKGADLRRALVETCEHIRDAAPEVPIILDAKRGDIGNTNEGYLAEAFEEIGADAVTVSPYLGGEALEPFLRMKDKGIVVLCRTSNEGAAEFQEREIRLGEDEATAFLPGGARTSRSINMSRSASPRRGTRTAIARWWSARRRRRR